MKIVYCIPGTYNSGGMERVLSNKANYLVAQGYDVWIVTTDQRGQKPFFQLDSRIQCVDLDVNYELTNGKSFFTKFVHYPFKVYTHKKRLSEFLQRIRPDITISMFCNEAPFLCSLHDGSKKVLEVHFSRFKRLQYNRTGLWRLADKWRNKNDLRVASRYDRFVTLTHEDGSYWHGLSNLVVIPNAQTFTCDVPADLNQPKVIAVGRYAYQKGFDLLLRAWALVSQRMPLWKLDIVGDGELRDDLLRQIHMLGLDESVRLCRATLDIQSMYKNSSVLALSSRYEGFGMVLLEAQTMGVPTVSFNCKCGPSEIIKDGVTGFLVPENDIHILADRLLCLMTDANLRKTMGHQAFVDSSRFSKEIIMKKWVDLFENLVLD